MILGNQCAAFLQHIIIGTTRGVAHASIGFDETIAIKTSYNFLDGAEVSTRFCRPMKREEVFPRKESNHEKTRSVLDLVGTTATRVGL